MGCDCEKAEFHVKRYALAQIGVGEYPGAGIAGWEREYPDCTNCACTGKYIQEKPDRRSEPPGHPEGFNPIWLSSNSGVYGTTPSNGWSVPLSNPASADSSSRLHVEGSQIKKPGWRPRLTDIQLAKKLPETWSEVRILQGLNDIGLQQTDL